MTIVYDQKDLCYNGWDVEFDTVIGHVGKAALLTIALLPSTILIARLLAKKTQDCVCAEFDVLEKIFKANREKDLGQGDIWWFFSSALTDRGVEMSDYERLERSFFDPRSKEDEVPIRCRVFYCDPYSSSQKPHIEQLHTLIRRVLPKKTSFDDLSQKDLDLICSHINSYSRQNLGGATPFEVAPAGFTDKLMHALGQKRIDPDKVCLTPKLLDR
jgi:IS30 family transposase